MNRYWNLSEQERSALTSEQVRAFLDVELMEKGVAKVEPPVLQPITELNLPCEPFYEIHCDGRYSPDSLDIVFATADAANAFLQLKPLRVQSEYEYGYTRCAAPCTGLSIKPVSLPPVSAVASAAVVLEQNRTAKQANDKAESEYKVAIKAVSDATSGVWDDWHECREKASRYQKVAETRAEYVKLCDGDESLAETFLAKSFADGTIKEAKEWFEDEPC